MKWLQLRLATCIGALLIAPVAWADEPTGLGRPIDVSLDGHRSDWMFNFVTVSISILFLIMVGVIFWASIVHRERPGHKALYDHGLGKKHVLFTTGLAAAIFFGIDGTALVHGWIDLTEGFWKFPSKADDPVEIEVFAQQWAWNFRYPGPDGQFNTVDDVVTLNRMHIPVGRPVMLKLKSKDVIHSFYLPNFRNKIDVFPGAVSKMWVQATAPGSFEIGCAQHCGPNHYKMRGFLTVESNEDFTHWIKDESQLAARRYDQADADAHWGWDWEI